MVAHAKFFFYNDVNNNSKGGNVMRKTYLDNIKWITVVLVVLYHVIYIFNGVQPFGVIGPFKEVQYQDLFMYIVYPWFMLLLFVVSGMSARYALNNKTYKEFIRSRTTKYLVPSTIGLFVFGWITGYYNMLIGGAFDSMGDAMPIPVLYIIMSISGSGPLWYIQLLWFFSLILVLIRKIEKDRLYPKLAKTPVPVIIAMVLPIWGAAQILNTPVVVVYRFGIYGLGFLLGYFVFSHDEVMDRLAKWWIPLTVLGVASGVFYTITFWGENYAEHIVLDTLICNLFAWFGTIGILAFMKKWGNFENAFSKWMVSKSWGLYVFHYLPIVVSSVYLVRITPALPPLVIYICVTIAAFAGAIILYEIISRIPFLRWSILGIKKQKSQADFI